MEKKAIGEMFKGRRHLDPPVSSRGQAYQARNDEGEYVVASSLPTGGNDIGGDWNVRFDVNKS